MSALIALIQQDPELGPAHTIAPFLRKDREAITLMCRLGAELELLEEIRERRKGRYFAHWGGAQHRSFEFGPDNLWYEHRIVFGMFENG